MTVLQAHQKALNELVRCGYTSEEARATARLLLREIVGVPHAHLTHGEKLLTPELYQQFEAALLELRGGRPLAYVLGKSEFYGIEIVCDERALIPRPETELLVEYALSEIGSFIPTSTSKESISEETVFRVVDLGTGTGCIAIAIAKNSAAGTEVYATDAAPPALSLAQENARRQGVLSQIQFLTGSFGDWAAPLREQKKEFDLLLSNPPYIPPREIERLQTQVREFEPRSALDGGLDGLECYRQLARQCKVLLKPMGTLACELGDGQFEEVRAIFEKNGWCVKEPVYDFAGTARVLVAAPVI